MRRIILLITIICSLLACDKYPDPSVTTVINYSFYFQAVQNTKFFQGDWVGDSIIFRVVNNNIPLQDSVRVLFTVVEGGGSVTVNEAYTDSQGVTMTRWKLGYDSYEQKLRAVTYDHSGNYLTTTELIEYAFKNDGWDPFTGSPDSYMSGLVADTINKVTYMIANNTLYKQGDKYYIWNAVSDSHLNSPRTINIDKNGIIYVGTLTGDIVKSSDHGLSWENCSKPYPDSPYYIYVCVSNDNFVWAFLWDHNPRVSKDGGVTWTDKGNGINKGLGNIFRLKDGSLLYHGTDCCSLYRSIDDGLTWTKLETPGFSLKLYVDDKDEIFICTQEAGIKIYKSTDYGVTYTCIYSVYPSWGSSMENTFNKWGNVYYILISGYGILKTSDLGNPAGYVVFYNNTDLYNLFIDNNGVLIARTHNTNIVYYQKISK
jgi:hypothetical protein